MKKSLIALLIITAFVFPVFVCAETVNETEDVFIVADASNNKTPVFGAEDTAKLKAAFGIYPGMTGRYFFDLSNENLVRAASGSSVICFEFGKDTCTVFSSCRKTAPKTDTAKFLQRSVVSNGKTTNYYLQVSYGYSDDEDEVQSSEYIPEISSSDISSDAVITHAPLPVIPVLVCIGAVIVGVGVYLYIKLRKKETEVQNG